jgi:hypothetical protein
VFGFTGKTAEFTKLFLVCGDERFIPDNVFMNSKRKVTRINLSVGRLLKGEKTADLAVR